MRGWVKGRRVVMVALAVVTGAAIAACGGGGGNSSANKTTSTRHTQTAGQATTAAQTTATAAPQASAVSLWSFPNADQDGTRAVSSKLTSSNVSQLGPAWSIPIVGVKGLYGVFSSTPVFGSNGDVYLQDLGNSVYAVNMKTGSVVWKHKVPASETNGEGPNGVALVNGVLYGETSRKAFALSANTGEQLWETGNLAEAAGQGFNMAPEVVGGKIYVSTSGQLHGGVAYSLDAKTGKVLWRFQETKQTSQRTAGGKTGTGGAWGQPVVEGNTVYLGIANPYRSIKQATKTPNKVLYNDSTIALDASTGKLKWYMQAVPNDFYDWDMQIGPMYAASGAGGAPTVVDAGKMGYVYAMTAQTGKLEWKTAVGKHNGHDNDPELGMAHKLKLTKFPYTVCPGPLGGVETQMAMASGVVYVPVNNLCDRMLNGRQPITDMPLPNPTKGSGDFEALNLKTGKVMWDTKLPSSPYGSATVTNDLVFTTTFAGKLIAMDRSTGKIVWQKQLPARTNSALAIDGDTLVTAASYASGKGQKAEIVAYRIGAHGSFATKGASAGGGKSASKVAGSAVSLSAGKQQFEKTCSSCHTLAEAGTHGTVGPNLDQLKPSDKLVTHQVINGGGGMPAFGNQLSKRQIANVAGYVSKVAGTGNKSLGGKSSGGGGGAP